MAKYKAIAKGYDGVQVREAGSVFEFEGKPGKWMKLVKASELEAGHSQEAEIPADSSGQKAKEPSSKKQKSAHKPKDGKSTGDAEVI